MNRVTDTCIPESEAMRRIESAVLEEWIEADRKGERFSCTKYCTGFCAGEN